MRAWAAIPPWKEPRAKLPRSTTCAELASGHAQLSERMQRQTTAQLAMVRRLCAHEAGGPGVEAHAAAAERVHQKIFARLASLLGVAGARALYARSVKLTMPGFPRLNTVDFDSARPTVDPTEPLMMHLRGEPPAAALETAVAVGANLLALLTTLIGQRLTFRVLRSAWPAFEVRDPNEEEKK